MQYCKEILWQVSDGVSRQKRYPFNKQRSKVICFLQNGISLFFCIFFINDMKLHIEKWALRCGILESMNEMQRGGALEDEGQASAG